MNTPNFNLYPPNGYRYLDPTGVELTGSTWPDLIQRVIAYRQQRNLPPGNPLEEVFAQFCSQLPNYCTDQKIAQAFLALSITPAGLAAQIEAWTADVFTRLNQQKLFYVNEDETSKRVDICIRCPQQTDWRVGCQGCSKNFEAVAQEILRKRPPGANSNALRACRVLHEDTRISSHVNLPHVTNDALPDNCWRKAR